MVKGKNDGEAWTTVVHKKAKVKAEEAAPHKPIFPNKVCFDWQAGRCYRDNCMYAHAEPAKDAKDDVKFKPRKVTRATLREIKSYVQKVLKMKFRDVPDKLPAHIYNGVEYYYITSGCNAYGSPRLCDVRKWKYNLGVKVYRPEEEVWGAYETLLKEVQKRLRPQWTKNTRSEDVMSVASSASLASSSWNVSSKSPSPSVIEESFFDANCKGSGKHSKATWSESPSSDTSSVSQGSVSVAATSEKMVVWHYPEVNVYSAPDMKSCKVATVKHGTLVTVVERHYVEPCSWVRTRDGWIMAHFRNCKTNFLVRPRPGQALRVKLANGNMSISVRKNPVDLTKEKLTKDPCASDVVGMLRNGDEVAVLERSGDWIRHALGWTLERLNGVEFFAPAVKRRTAGNKGTKGMCYEFLQNGYCAKFNCPFSHEAKTTSRASKAQTNFPAQTLMGLKKALAAKNQDSALRVADLKDQRKKKYKVAMFKR